MPWMRERPVWVKSSKNFGQDSRERGQRRVPAPPAGTTAQKSLSGAGKEDRRCDEVEGGGT